MKKIFAVLICFVMLVCITACGSHSVIETTAGSTSGSASASKPQVKYYEGTRIPTVDSVVDAKLLTDLSDEDFFYYGGFTDAEDVEESMVIYAEYVKKTCGYTYKVASSNSIAISTDKGPMVVMGANLSGRGWLICHGLPD